VEQSRRLAGVPGRQPKSRPDFLLAMGSTSGVIAICLGKRFTQARDQQPETRFVPIVRCCEVRPISHRTNSSRTGRAESRGATTERGAPTRGGCCRGSRDWVNTPNPLISLISPGRRREWLTDSRSGGSPRSVTRFLLGRNTASFRLRLSCRYCMWSRGASRVLIIESANMTWNEVGR
jgi:hypothetical protein